MMTLTTCGSFVAMPSKRAILELLTRDELLEIATIGSVEVSSKDELVTNEAGSQKTVLVGVLRRYSRDRLKEMCRSLGVDGSGDDKAQTLERLLWTGRDGGEASSWSATPSRSEKSRGRKAGLTQVHALGERQHLAIEFPNVTGFFAVKEALRCDLDKAEPLRIEPVVAAETKLVRTEVGWKTVDADADAASDGVTPETFYTENPLHRTASELANDITEVLTRGSAASGKQTTTKLRLDSARLLKSDVYRFVKDYIECRVELMRGARIEDIALASYRDLVIQRVLAAIEVDPEGAAPALLPRIDLARPVASTADVRIRTKKPTMETKRSHVSHVVIESASQEGAVAHLEESPNVVAYVKNDGPHVGILYEWKSAAKTYAPDFVVRMLDGATWMIELERAPREDDEAKWLAARKWIIAINNHGGFGRWKHVVCKDNPEVLHKLLTWPAPPTDDGSEYASVKPSLPWNQREWWERPRKWTRPRRGKYRRAKWKVDAPPQQERKWLVACRCGKTSCDGVRVVSESGGEMTVRLTGAHAEDPDAKAATERLIELLADMFIKDELAKREAGVPQSPSLPPARSPRRKK